ncbi:hypothetical protein SAMN05421789_104259 [Kaistella chaponensis]|uniref:DUF2971 domain-containing protein n=1 Tax=Kaistella chaponensis TaxID=713588 RepID=A0A1N7L6F4_9FLAO|nr:hypothetical protein [Kaistella chaponensis]SIS69419.1 hypothetical protein SAMN05421789_104259 [Kaistella chaponensis]
MYIEHPEFIIERAKDLPLWRYMDFWKFLKLLNSSELYFPNVEMMGDQHEGKIPQKIFDLMLKEDELLGRKNKFAQNYKEFIENRLRKKTLILSWNANSTESFAFWKMYAKEKLGIAIKTNLDRLKNSVKDAEENIYIGEVRYYDDNKPTYRTGNTFYTFLTKNNYYEFESEVRCIAQIENDNTATSKNIKVDLDELIEEVYISPFAEKSGLLEIIEFLREKNNLSFKICISGVNDTWI